MPTLFCSALRISYSRTFIPAAQTWATQFAKSLSAPETLTFSLNLLIEESLLFIIDKYPDTTGQPDLQIRCSVAPNASLQVEIDDLGPPIPAFLASPEELAKDPSLGLWLTLSRGYAPDFQFINRGKAGWQIRFSLASDSWSLPQIAHNNPQVADTTDLSHLEARPVLPADVAEIARLTYATYRYSYQHPEIYNFELYAQKLATGQHDVFVVPHNDKLVGMAAIKYGGVFERGAEAGALMVDPDYRGRGIRQTLDEFFEYHYENNPRDLDFFYGYQVTQHDKSQRGADPGEANYFGPTSFFLNKNPAIKFIGLQSTELTRDSSIEVFMPLRELDVGRFFVPSPAHKQIIELLLRDLNLTPKYVVANAEPKPHSETTMICHEHESSRYVNLQVLALGSDWTTKIASELIKLFAKGHAAVRILIDATSDFPSSLHGELNRIGAGFCGVSLLSQHKIALSYVIAKDPVGFDNIVTYRDSARQLLAFIKAEWPGQIADTSST